MPRTTTTHHPVRPRISEHKTRQIPRVNSIQPPFLFSFVSKDDAVAIARGSSESKPNGRFRSGSPLAHVINFQPAKARPDPNERLDLVPSQTTFQSQTKPAHWRFFLASCSHIIRSSLAQQLAGWLVLVLILMDAKAGAAAPAPASHRKHTYDQVSSTSTTLEQPGFIQCECWRLALQLIPGTATLIHRNSASTA